MHWEVIAGTLISGLSVSLQDFTGCITEVFSWIEGSFSYTRLCCPFEGSKFQFAIIGAAEKVGTGKFKFWLGISWGTWANFQWKHSILKCTLRSLIWECLRIKWIYSTSWDYICNSCSFTPRVLDNFLFLFWLIQFLDSW